MATPPMPPSDRSDASGPWRTAVGAFVIAGLRIYFRRIERFHVERAPREGATLFVSNHPGSITDAFIIGASVPRVVHFVATVKLFQVKPVAALLRRCGVVPINRRQDDPAGMRSVAETFAHCHRVLEHGGAIGIFPEGVSYNDEQMRPVKTGAARMALEIEDRHDGRLGLQMAPVGLTYAAKGRYRQDVLAQFGEPFRAADWLPGYRRDHHAAVRELTAAIEQRIKQLILDLPSLEHQRIVASVKRLYLDRLREHNLLIQEEMPEQAEVLRLTQAIADALKYFEAQAPDQLAAFVEALWRYERRLAQAGLGDRTIAQLEPSGPAALPRWVMAAGLLASAPVAAYGWLHRFFPTWVVEWAVDRFSPRENLRAQAAHASMIAGLIAFGGVYLAAATAMAWLAGWRWALVYLASLPVTGLFAFHWVRALYRVAGDVRASHLLRRLPLTRRALVRTRTRLIAEIDGFRERYRREVLKMGSSTG